MLALLNTHFYYYLSHSIPTLLFSISTFSASTELYRTRLLELSVYSNFHGRFFVTSSHLKLSLIIHFILFRITLTGYDSQALWRYGLGKDSYVRC